MRGSDAALVSVDVVSLCGTAGETFLEHVHLRRVIEVVGWSALPMGCDTPMWAIRRPRPGPANELFPLVVPVVWKMAST